MLGRVALQSRTHKDCAKAAYHCFKLGLLVQRLAALLTEHGLSRANRYPSLHHCLLTEEQVPAVYVHQQEEDVVVVNKEGDRSQRDALKQITFGEKVIIDGLIKNDEGNYHQLDHQNRGSQQEDE